jgi:hypothetical protein
MPILDCSPVAPSLEIIFSNYNLFTLLSLCLDFCRKYITLSASSFSASVLGSFTCYFSIHSSHPLDSLHLKTVTSVRLRKVCVDSSNAVTSNDSESSP